MAEIERVSIYGSITLVKYEGKKVIPLTDNNVSFKGMGN